MAMQTLNYLVQVCHTDILYRSEYCVLHHKIGRHTDRFKVDHHFLLLRLRLRYHVDCCHCGNVANSNVANSNFSLQSFSLLLSRWTPPRKSRRSLPQRSLISLTIGIGTGNTSTLATFSVDSCKWFHGVTLSIAKAEDYTIVIREGSAPLKTLLNCLEIAA